MSSTFPVPDTGTENRLVPIFEYLPGRIERVAGLGTESSLHDGDAFAAALAKVEANDALLKAAKDEDEVDRLADVETDVVEALLETPARDLKDVLLKIELFQRIGSYGHERDAENLAFITSDIERFERVAA